VEEIPVVLLQKTESWGFCWEELLLAKSRDPNRCGITIASGVEEVPLPIFLLALIQCGF